MPAALGHSKWPLYSSLDIGTVALGRTPLEVRLAEPVVGLGAAGPPAQSAVVRPRIGWGPEAAVSPEGSPAAVRLPGPLFFFPWAYPPAAVRLQGGCP